MTRGTVLCPVYALSSDKSQEQYAGAVEGMEELSGWKEFGSGAAAAVGRCGVTRGAAG